MNHTDLRDRFTRPGQSLIVLAETAATTKPCERSLNNPPSGKHHESLLVIAPFDDVEDPVAKSMCPLDQASSIASIRPDAFEPRKPSGDSHHDELGTVAILDACRMDDHGEQQAGGVNDNMTLATIDLFPCVVTTNTSHLSRFYALTVNDSSAGAGFSPHAYSQIRTQSIVHDFPNSSQSPLSEMVVDCLPLGEIVRQHTPLTSSSYYIEDRAHDFSQTDLSWAPRPTTKNVLEH